MPVRKPKSSKSSQPHPLEAALGHSFHDPKLLVLALTHRSLAYEARNGAELKNPPGTDNEQLEFLGDAVLGVLISELLYEQFPECDEGQLTRLRAALVSRKRMAEAGKALGLGTYIEVGESAARSGIRERPAVLANCAEAVIAAVYLDTVRHGDAHELSTLRALLRRLLLEPDLEQLRAAVAERTGGSALALRDYKTILQERVQATGAGNLRYVDTDMTGPAHDRRFFLDVQVERASGAVALKLASGNGTSKREAQQLAACRALEAWEGLVPAWLASSAEPHP